MRLPLAALALVLLAPGPAHAATVGYSHVDGNKYTYTEDAVNVVGDAADDRLTAAIGPGGIDLEDATAPLALIGPAGPCAPVDEHRVHCAIEQVVGSLRLDGGDGADRLTVVRPPGWTATFATLSGGAGDDALTGSAAVEDLDGGPGRDVVRGLGGDDRLRATTPDDGDVIDGGEGFDQLEIHGAGLVVDLAAGAIAGAGGTVALPGVEAVTIDPGSSAAGTEGADVLAGGGLLDGRGGDDRITGWAPNPQVLRGGDGDDVIDYGSHDDVEGGPGDDVVEAQGLGGRAYAIHCGAGEDVVVPYKNDVAARDCEWMATIDFRLRNDLRVVRGGSALRLTALPRRPGCGIVASAVQPGVPRAVTALARVRTTVRAGVPLTATLPLRSSGRRQLARGRLRAPRVSLQRARRCPSHGRWTLAPTLERRLSLAPAP